ncbi:hypothetical protein INT45_007689 [Circinella minor]|uniref:CCHC-type domain-containing protein n=1 Tax=Circinella minor TaxID=1195481 RepID=A0A8H7V6N9_9FUNG|nr:hypothetical protein INT45_007689 [Circinella minor]
MPKTWREFQAAFRAEFKPRNSAQMARNKLRALTQAGTSNGSIREYVTEFRNVLLNNPMSLVAAYNAAETFEAVHEYAAGIRSPSHSTKSSHPAFRPLMNSSVQAVGPTPMELDVIDTRQSNRSHRCYNCGGRRHFARECPSPQQNQNNRDPPISDASSVPLKELSNDQEIAARQPPLIDLSDNTLLDMVEEKREEHQDNFRHFESLNLIKNTDLPLYSMICNGKTVDVLLDSGASCTYVSPFLAAGCPVQSVSNREVETAGGHRFAINRAVTLSLDAAGLTHQVFAYVLDTKFD